MVKFDLRPSEKKKIYDLEIGEPGEFSEAIKRYRQKLADKIVL
jgi:hypothetical protein